VSARTKVGCRGPQGAIVVRAAFDSATEAIQLTAMRADTRAVSAQVDQALRVLEELRALCFDKQKPHHKA
jgi:hypothetical protein